MLGFVTSLGQQDEVRRDSLHGVEKVKIVNCKNPSFVISLLFPSQLRSYKCTPFSHELQELRDLELHQVKLFEKRYSRTFKLIAWISLRAVLGSIIRTWDLIIWDISTKEGILLLNLFSKIISKRDVCSQSEPDDERKETKVEFLLQKLLSLSCTPPPISWRAVPSS